MTVPQPVRRTMSPWETAPRDGTPFHILNTLRFNPFAKQFEGLCYSEEGLTWQAIGFPNNEPTWWLRQVPLPYEIPTSFAFTWSYEVRRKTWRERLMERLLGRLSDVMRFTLFHSFASAMSASGQDPEEGLEAKPASAVGEAETPNA